MSNWVVAGKLFSLGPVFGFGPFPMSAGNLVYPMSCVFGDVLTEVYGFNRTRRLIWTGLIAGLIFLAVTQVAIALPPHPAYSLQAAFAAVNGSVLRVVIASYSAYVVCEFTNSYVIAKMKVWQSARNFPLRAALSTVIAQFVDSIAFFTIAFYGVIPVRVLILTIITGWLFKSLYEIVALPVTTVAVGWLKRQEGIEHFDRHPLVVLGF